jgi:acyl carrier protein
MDSVVMEDAVVKDLARRLKEIIVESLNLEGTSPESIDDQEPLFGEGLGLDSVDALELVVALEKEYGIKIRSDEIDPQAFATVDSLSRFVAGRRAAAEGAAG